MQQQMEQLLQGQQQLQGRLDALAARFDNARIRRLNRDIIVSGGPEALLQPLHREQVAAGGDYRPGDLPPAGWFPANTAALNRVGVVRHCRLRSDGKCASCCAGVHRPLSTCALQLTGPNIDDLEVFYGRQFAGTSGGCSVQMHQGGCCRAGRRRHEQEVRSSGGHRCHCLWSHHALASPHPRLTHPPTHLWCSGLPAQVLPGLCVRREHASVRLGSQWPARSTPWRRLPADALRPSGGGWGAAPLPRPEASRRPVKYVQPPAPLDFDTVSSLVQLNSSGLYSSTTGPVLLVWCAHHATASRDASCLPTGRIVCVRPCPAPSHAPRPQGGLFENMWMACRLICSACKPWAQRMMQAAVDHRRRRRHSMQAELLSSRRASNSLACYCHPSAHAGKCHQRFTAHRAAIRKSLAGFEQAAPLRHLAPRS